MNTSRNLKITRNVGHSREACGSDADVSSASLKSTCDGLIKDLTRGEDINYIFLNWHSQ